MCFASLYPSRLLSNRKKYRPIFLHLAPKRQWLRHHFAPFCMLFQSVEGEFKPFFALHIIAFALRFATFHPAFCCILHCVLVHFALRFGAKWSAFCCILPCVLVHFAPYFAANSVVWRTKCIFKQRQADIHPPLYMPCFVPKQVGAILAKMWASRGLAGKIAAIMLNIVRKTLHSHVGAFVNTA